MVRISICMIVKNEEKILARCLDSLAGIGDEIVIVDTGSTDRTKEIAGRYTSHIYDYKWIDDFAAARNYAFSLATQEYVYMADADEVLDAANRKKFLELKQVLDPQIEIVQMYYANQLDKGIVYNYDKEYRPKLYKRVRSFFFEDPIHETVRLEPVIYDSDISILHMPQDCHAPRDFAAFQRILEKGQPLSKKLFFMYAKELFISGEEQDFLDAEAYFQKMVHTEELDVDRLKTAECVLVRAAHIRQDIPAFFTAALHNVADGNASAEVCYELGMYYKECKDYEEAGIWFQNAAYETQSQCNIHYQTDWPKQQLEECMKKLVP